MKLDRDTLARKYYESAFRRIECETLVINKFINELAKNKDEKVMKVIYGLDEIKDSSIPYGLFYHIANHIIGDCSIKEYRSLEKMETIICVKKL